MIDPGLGRPLALLAQGSPAVPVGTALSGGPPDRTSGILVVWFHRIYVKGMEIPVPKRPWYLWKTDLSFADLVRAAQETLRGVNALDFAVAILERDPNVFKGARGEKKAVERRSTEEQELAKAA